MQQTGTVQPDVGQPLGLGRALSRLLAVHYLHCSFDCTAASLHISSSNWLAQPLTSLLPAAAKPFQLSLCGATSLTHESVSALLRLPVLTDLRIDGCPKIQALDKMRLIAKVCSSA